MSTDMNSESPADSQHDAVYVLTNKAMPGMVKIGFTRQGDVQKRIDELYTTGVPLKFHTEWACRIKNAAEAEKAKNFEGFFAARQRSIVRPYHAVLVRAGVGPRAGRLDGWLSNDLKPDRTQPKGLIVNSRILWAFSAVHRARPEKLFQQMADRALDFVMNRFWDAQHGGAFWRLDDTGRVLDDSKKIYGQAFYIYALAEYHQAFGGNAALERAIQLFELIERHAHDPKHGGYIEVCRAIGPRPARKPG
jgi:hypothetical protein